MLNIMQTKPLRNYGIDVTQTSFKPIMAELGLDKSVNELTQAEKEVLRYIATLNQAQNAMGDFANTIESPANQLKVLKQQFYEMQAAIGNLFVGAFARILPYVNAIIMVIKELAKIIASFFGIKMKDYNTGISSYASDLDDYSASLGGVGDSAKGASDSIKELKRQTLGFDQINNITSPTPKSGSGGSGGGGGGGIAGGIDKSLLDAIKDYDNGMEKVRMKANKIRDAIMKWLGFTKQVNEKTGEITWKLKEGWSNIKSIGVLLGGALVFGVVKKILDKIIAIYDWSKKVKAIFSGGAAATGAGGASGASGLLGFSGLEIAGIFSSAIIQAGNLYHQVKKIKDLYKETGSLGDAMRIDSVGDFFSKALAISSISQFFGAGGLLVTSVLEFGAAIDIVKDKIKGISPETKREVAEIKKMLDPLRESVYSFASDLTQLKLGVVIDESARDTIMEHLDGITKEMKEKIEKEKTEMKERLGKLLSDGLISQEEYDKGIKRIEEMYDGAAKTTEEAQNNIKTILDKAASKRRSLTKDEMAEVQKNYDTIKTNIVKSITDNKNEQKVLLDEIKNQSERISVETASTMIKNAQKARDETIKAAEEQYTGTIEQYKLLKEAGVISEETYDKISKDAETTKNNTINEAKLQYDGIWRALKENNSDISKYIDKDTGGVKKSWKKHYQDLNDETVKGFNKVKEKTKTGLINAQNLASQYPIKLSVDDSGIYNAFKSIDTMIGNKKYKMKTSTTGEVSFEKYATGGLPSTGQMFIAREAGPELVGRIGNRTAVANNDQIISGIERGVYNAVASAMGNGNIGAVQIDLHTDEGVVVDRINKITRQTGTCPIDI